MAGKQVLGSCPVCGQPLDVTELHCKFCDTAVKGRFQLCKFCRLTAEQQKFVEVFIAARGNIKEVERVLGISYPTVRGRLDGVIGALGYKVERDKEKDAAVSAKRRREILEALDRGEISAGEAIQQLKG